MQDIQTWAAEEFAAASLGDARRTRRLIRLAVDAASSPGGVVTHVVTSGARREAAYRFVENDAVSADAIGDAVFAACARRCAPYESVVVALDQSELSITDRSASKGLGRVGGIVVGGRARGFQAMSAVAVSPDNGAHLGLLGQAWFKRPNEKSPPRRDDARPIEERESGLWLRCMRKASGALREHAPNTRPWFQLDRGADINHVLEAANELDVDFTIRSGFNRRLDTGAQLRSALRKRAPLARVTTVIADSHAPAGVARLRRVTLALRARTVVLRLQNQRGRRYGSLKLNAVHVCETKGSRRSRLEWFLLTNVAVESLDDAWTVVQSYRGRWRVEEFHRAWKTGVCDVESSQLRSPEAFRRWATILAAVASRAEHLKTISRSDPDRSATDVLTRDEIDAAIVLSETKAHKLGDELTLEQAVELIAFVGGYTGRRNAGGPPGTKIIARGLHDVTVAARALAGARRSGQ